MRQSTKRFVSFACSFLLLLGAAVAYFSLISPAYDDLQILRQDESSRAQFVQNEQAAVRKVRDLITTYQNQSGIEDAISQTLPQTPDVSGALLELNGIAGVVHMSMQQLSITQALLNVNVAVPAVSSSRVGGVSGPFGEIVAPLGTLTFHLQVSGTYESFKDFLKDVETNIRIFSVQNFSVHPGSPTLIGRAASNVFSYDVTVETYYQSKRVAPH